MAKITFTIPDEKVETVLNYFVTAEPIPTDMDGKPKYTPVQWVRQWIILKVKQAIQKGKNVQEATKIEDDIIQ